MTVWVLKQRFQHEGYNIIGVYDSALTASAEYNRLRDARTSRSFIDEVNPLGNKLDTKWNEDGYSLDEYEVK